jgi:hypothetical protein
MFKTLQSYLPIYISDNKQCLFLLISQYQPSFFIDSYKDESTIFTSFLCQTGVKKSTLIYIYISSSCKIILFILQLFTRNHNSDQ